MEEQQRLWCFINAVLTGETQTLIPSTPTEDHVTWKSPIIPNPFFTICPQWISRFQPRADWLLFVCEAPGFVW